MDLSHDTCVVERGLGGSADERYLVVSRRSAAGGSGGAAGGSGADAGGDGFGQDIMARLRFRDDAWKQLLIKYDARHFMGNW